MRAFKSKRVARLSYYQLLSPDRLQIRWTIIMVMINEDVEYIYVYLQSKNPLNAVRNGHSFLWFDNCCVVRVVGSLIFCSTPSNLTRSSLPKVFLIEVHPIRIHLDDLPTVLGAGFPVQRSNSQ